MDVKYILKHWIPVVEEEPKIYGDLLAAKRDQNKQMSLNPDNMYLIVELEEDKK